MKTCKKRIGVLTGGGDCPGLNAVVRAIVKTAILDYGIQVMGILNGFEGLIDDEMRPLSMRDVSGILHLGGTILGTSNTANPFRHPVEERGKKVYKDVSDQAVQVFHEESLDALILIGGDGTQNIGYKLMEKGVPVVGVPKTIDNDLQGTEVTFGYDTALQTATEAIDKLHSTAESHHRIMVVEVMGRYAGWIALGAGVAGGGDVILIPEIPYDIDAIADKIMERKRRGKNFSIIVVAEGAKTVTGELGIQKKVADSTDPIRLGGIGQEVGDQLEEITGQETRVTVLGHLQRGGSPSPFDRNLATMFGWKAVQLVVEGKFGHMAAWQGGKVTSVPVETAIASLKTVPPDSHLLLAARSTGVSFGERKEEKSTVENVEKV